MATTVTSNERLSGFGATERRDNWWIGPLATAVGLGLFGVYATFRAAYNAEYHLGVGTGEMESGTGGRPAELYRFKREALRKTGARGLTAPLVRSPCSGITRLNTRLTQLTMVESERKLVVSAN